MASDYVHSNVLQRNYISRQDVPCNKLERYNRYDKQNNQTSLKSIERTLAVLNLNSDPNCFLSEFVILLLFLCFDWFASK